MLASCLIGHAVTSSADSSYALTNSLQPVRRAWQQAAGAALAASGLSASVATVILLVSRLGDGVRQHVLAEEVGVNPAALVRTLDQAEEAQLLERRGVPGNRRVRAIFLLPEGRRLAVAMEETVTTLRETLLGDIPREDIDIAVRVLRTFEERARRHFEEERAQSR